MLEVIKNELNSLEVIESSAAGEELEYVLIKNNKENQKKINDLLCLAHNWAIIPENFAPGTYEFINDCKKESGGYLDLVYLVYNFFEGIDVERLGFSQKRGQWELEI